MGSGSGAIVCVMSAVEEGENCAGGDAAAPSLTQGELKIICDDFDECDADKDGRLSMPEIKQLLHKQLERVPTEKESEDWLRQFDSNLDGDVTLQEYLSTMMPGGYCPPPPPEGWEPHVQAKFGYLHFSDTLLGQGAAGSVWSGKYWDGLRSIDVAIKVIGKVSSRRTRQDWLREAMVIGLLSKWDHPHVMKYYEVFEMPPDSDQDCTKLLPGDGCLIMECGVPIKANPGSLHDERALMSAQVLVSGIKCLAFVHLLGVFHRDIKVPNFVHASDGTIRMVDFSACKVQLYEGMQGVKKIGTDMYMAPEIVLSNKYDSKVDIFSLAITVLYCYSGQYPFNTSLFNAYVKKPTARNKRALAASYTDQVGKLLDGGGQLLELVKAVVEKMLVFEPEKRASAGELLEMEEIKEIATLCGVPMDPELIERVTEKKNNKLATSGDMLSLSTLGLEGMASPAGGCAPEAGSAAEEQSEFIKDHSDLFARFDFDGDGEVSEADMVMVRDEVHNAIAHKDPHVPQIVAGWLELNPDITVKGPQGCTLPELLCKHASSRNGNGRRGSSMMQMVLDTGSISSDELGRLFLIAIDAHNPNCCDFAELFIDAGMDLNVKDANGSTVLHRMAVDGDIDSVELLLQRGADVDSLDGDGRTPMLAAAATHTNNVLRIVKMLIKKGAKKDACDKQNKNAYELAKSPKVRKFFRPW